MAEKVIQTRIINKHGALSDWLTSKTVLKEGEIALAYVETTKPDGQGGYYTVPTYLMKVGDGTHTFSGLEWVAAPASDVYEWAKKANLALSDIPMVDVKESLKDTFYTEAEIDTKLASLNTAIGGKAPSSHTHGNITNGGALDTASRVVITDANKKITISDITIEELGRLDGVTSNIQTQLNGKATKATTLAGYGITNAYTKGEVDSEVSALETAIGKKADSGHNHDSVYIKPADVDSKIATALSSALKYKGTVETTAKLPTTSIATGDVYNITSACAASGSLPKVNAGDNVAWNGSAWDVLAGTVDLSGYYTSSTVDSKLAGKSNTDHTHKYAGSSSVGGAANSVKSDLTFSTSGNGAASGTTYNGSTARTISYNSVGAAAASHTHTKSQITDFAHNHDDRYYTESEADARFAPVSHGTHVTAATVKSALGTGTGTTKFLREDGTWVKPSYTSDTHRTWKVNGTVVSGLSGTKDAVNLKQGTNINISSSGTDITVSAPNVYTKSEVDSLVGAVFNEIVFDCGGPND